MLNYTHKWLECPRCSRYKHFKVFVLNKNKKYFYLTQCPTCKSYDEVKEITLREVGQLGLTPYKGKVPA